MPEIHTPTPQPQTPPPPFPAKIPDDRELIIGDVVESDEEPEPVHPEPRIN